jgi:hypothetical protein
VSRDSAGGTVSALGGELWAEALAATVTISAIVTNPIFWSSFTSPLRPLARRAGGAPL